MSLKRCFIVSVLWMLTTASSLMGIDVHALANAEAKSAELATQLVSASNKILEEAIDRGRDYREVKKLDHLYQEAKGIKLVVAPNAGAQEGTKKEGLEEAFKKALERPVDLDKALDLVDALQKELKETKWSTDITPVLTLTNQLQNSLHTAMDLKAQWLNTRKAN
ncbi:hypothetical protein ACFOPX_01545 [Helicobacter baculiformis]|uniref:Uncharacterized protein n=1 Tax=Helicobacter baculiformis TaxID=427351 RepID=A0ABV7ZGD7_9HELI|nr:hypothetical protein [Helicobacter baculiformis]